MCFEATRGLDIPPYLRNRTKKEENFYIEIEDFITSLDDNEVTGIAEFIGTACIEVLS